jgi:Holliday junction resolvase RusA-like endonuclease
MRKRDMNRVIHNREYRFAVPGIAASFRTKSSKKYKLRIKKEAKKLFKRPLLNMNIEIRIDYFHIGKRKFDMDNVAKSVLDALNKIAYLDDKQASLQSAEAHYLGAFIRLHGGPVDIVKPMKYYPNYTFIRLRAI